MLLIRDPLPHGSAKCMVFLALRYTSQLPGLLIEFTLDPDRSSTPSEGIGLEARSMVSVAVKVSSQNAERNVKVNYKCQQFL